MKRFEMALSILAILLALTGTAHAESRVLQSGRFEGRSRHTANGGAQVYRLPSRIDSASFNELWIWCEKFNVPLGIARFR